MALAGGSADKVGNEYETWWTLRRVTQLLRGEIDAMTVEPIGAGGAELWVECRGKRTYDQVKFRSSGRWTPAKLRSDGVLTKLTRQYSTGSRVLLVLSQPSEELERLIILANATSSATELWSSAPNANDLELLRDAWGITAEETRAYLLQTSVRHDSLVHLKEFVELVVETLVLGSATEAIGVLRQFLEDTINTTFTAPQVWAALGEVGIAPRPRLEPGPTVSRLQTALQRYSLAVRRSAPDAGVVSRREVGAIVKTVTESKAPILLVAGKAGAGKSVVVCDAAAELARLGRHVAAVRLDHLDPATSTATQLGKTLDLEGSPVVALSEVSPAGFDGILVIDQLDAVSSYSGRMPSVYDAVDEALSQARLLGNVRVILAVRSIDLEEDPRLRRLAGEDVPIIEVGELDASDVETYLGQLGGDVSTLSPTTLQLLRLPIHLYIFSELDPAMRSAPFKTLASLYAAFTRTFRTRLELDGYPDEWPEVSRVLVERMNADEALTAPASSVEHIRPLYVEALISANVLVEDGGRIALFHETYFDYLFAKSFKHRGSALVDWFASTGQGLFRRSQLRQLLAHIATEERDQFVPHVLAIADSSLRSHLISIAYTVLESFSPTQKDWTDIRRLTTTDNAFAARVISLIGGPSWFAAADVVGDVERLLDDPDWGDVTARLVGRLAADSPSRVLDLLGARQSNGEEWVRALRGALDVTDSPAWADFALDQVDTGGLDLPDDPFDALASPLFHRLVEGSPSDALRLLTSTLIRDIDRAIAAGEESLEDVLSRRGHHSIENDQVQQLATVLNSRFVDALLPLIERIATYEPVGGRRIWSYRITRAPRDFGEALFYAFDGALSLFTRSDPTHAIPMLERLSDHHVDALDFLVCRALHGTSPDRAVDWILESAAHRAIGWLSDPRWESRRLIENASRACTDERFTALESCFLYWNPDYVSPASKLRWRGLAELELMSALASDRLSPSASRRLAELRRKFPEWQPTEPQGISGGFVQSPIDHASAGQMSDANWLSAIEKYTRRDHRTFRDGRAFGGIDELASAMGTYAKKDPARFLRLAMGFPASTPSTYSDHVIRNIAGEVSQEEILGLLRKVRANYPTQSGRTLVSAINEYVQDMSDGLFEELLALANDPDPSRELAQVRTNSGFYFGGDFVSAGINSTRGQVASTLGRVIFADHSRLEHSLPTLGRLVTDPVIAVRSLAAEPVLAFASIDRAAGLKVLEVLLDDDLVLTTHPALHALRWAMLWEADRFAPFLVRALNGAGAKEAGAHWANCAVNGALGSAPGDIGALPEDARIGAAEALAPSPGLAPEILCTLFHDTSSEVRRQATRSLHFLKEADSDSVAVLIGRFVDSVAFEEAPGDLVDALEDLPGELPPITWDVCQRVIESIATSPPASVAAMTRNLIAVLVRLYRSSGERAREQALDLIDQTVLLQFWRVDQVLDGAM